jgi:hypothetical protein
MRNHMFQIVNLGPFEKNPTPPLFSLTLQPAQPPKGKGMVLRGLLASTLY